MSQELPIDHISTKGTVYAIPGMERAMVRKDVMYRSTDAGPLTMDVYRPADTTAGAQLPAVIFVAGYNDAGSFDLLDDSDTSRAIIRQVLDFLRASLT